jgi:hypothetical protein
VFDGGTGVTCNDSESGTQISTGIYAPQGCLPDPGDGSCCGAGNYCDSECNICRYSDCGNACCGDEGDYSDCGEFNNYYLDADGDGFGQGVVA